MQTDEMRQVMSTLAAFSEDERAYHAHHERQEFLRQQRSIHRHLLEARSANPSLSPPPSLPRIFNELEFLRGRVGHYICETSACGSTSVFSVLPGRWGKPRAL